MGGSAGEPSGVAGGPLGIPGGSVGPSTGGSVGAAGAVCGFETVAAPVFLDQRLEGNAAARLELHSWTTDAQASTMRADQVGKFVTPTLLGVGLRPALFHDGCAKSIEQRFGV